jgi:hypothetical protein
MIEMNRYVAVGRVQPAYNVEDKSSHLSSIKRNLVVLHYVPSMIT